MSFRSRHDSMCKRAMLLRTSDRGENCNKHFPFKSAVFCETAAKNHVSLSFDGQITWKMSRASEGHFQVGKNPTPSIVYRRVKSRQPPKI